MREVIQSVKTLALIIAQLLPLFGPEFRDFKVAPDNYLQNWKHAGIKLNFATIDGTSLLWINLTFCNPISCSVSLLRWSVFCRYTHIYTRTCSSQETDWLNGLTWPKQKKEAVVVVRLQISLLLLLLNCCFGQQEEANLLHFSSVCVLWRRRRRWIPSICECFSLSLPFLPFLRNVVVCRQPPIFRGAERASFQKASEWHPRHFNIPPIIGTEVKEEKGDD